MILRNLFRGIVYLSFFSILSCQEHEFPVKDVPKPSNHAAGKMAPVITEFFPEEGVPGDTIEIRGKYFNAALGNIEVHFGSVESNVLSIVEDIITCVVPTGIAEPAIALSVTLASQTSRSPTQFRLLSPVIDAFSPGNGSFGDMITIRGSNFSTVALDNHVQFNQYAARVMEASKTSLTVRVPLGLTEKAHTISVTVNDQRAEAASKFEMLAPVIEAVFPRSGPLGTDVTIQGANFSTDLRANEVMFGNMAGRLISASKNELKVRIVQGIYDSRDPGIKVKVAGQTVDADAFHVEDAWMEKNTTSYNGIDFGTAFVIDDNGYAGLGAPGSKTIYKYSVTTNQWTEIATFPGAGRDHATSFVLNGKAYVGGGGRDPLRSDFYRYDPAADAWERIADFPFGISEAVGVTRNGKGYVLARDPIEDVSRLWVYDPAANKWQTLSSNQTGAVGDAGFVVGGRLFIFAFIPDGNYHQLLEFDFGTSGWVHRGSRVDADRHPTAFALNGKGYVISKGALMEYNPSGDTWKTLPGEHPSARQGALGFVIEDKVYFGFGHSGASRLKDFWEGF